MSIIDRMRFIGEDLRRRRYLLPSALAGVTGTVTAPEELLKQKTMQIGLNETSYTVLENGADGANASVLLDFGQELHGGIRLMVFEIEGEANPLIQITFGESAGEAESEIGEKGAANAHSARQFTIPAPAWSDQEWGQTGFRFVKLKLLSKNTVLKLKSALAVFVYRDYPYLGGFESDDEMLNRIYEVSAYTCHLNLQNMVWDGIKRDRLVWIGDMMPECLTIRDVFGAILLVEESLDFVKGQTPLPGWMNGLPSYSMWWLMIVWEWYMSCGSETFLEAQREYVLPLLDQLCSAICADGTDLLPGYFFDWPTHETKAEKSGVRCLLRMALDCGASLAEQYGDEARKCRCQSCRALLNKQEEYADSEKQIIAFMGLTGAADAAFAAKQIEQGGASGFSTFLLYDMLRMVAQGDSTAAALKLMKEYLSGMLDRGATSFWEDFNPAWAETGAAITALPAEGQTDLHGDYGAFCYTGFRHSLCHGWASGAVPFLTEYVLGIRILEPGCRKLLIRPDLAGLNRVKGRFPTPFGVVSLTHEKDAQGSIVSTVKAPAEVEVVLQNCKLVK